FLKAVTEVEVDSRFAAVRKRGVQVQPVPAPAQAVRRLQQQPWIVVPGYELAVFRALAVLRDDSPVRRGKAYAEVAKLVAVSSRALPGSRGEGSVPVSHPLPARQKVAEDQGSFRG